MESLVRAPEAARHLVERRRERRRLGAASERHLALPVAGGDFSGGCGDVLERAREVPAEAERAGQREREDDRACSQQLPLQLVKELLRRLPVLQENETPDLHRAVSGRKGKDPGDVAAAGERLELPRRALQIAQA